MPESLVRQLESEFEKINHEITVLEERRKAIEKLLASYGGLSASGEHEDHELPTIQMARKVLEETGAPMATSEIRRAIQRKFRVVPASSLQQMLYNRAANQKVFFNQDKKYGLLEWKAKR